MVRWREFERSRGKYFVSRPTARNFGLFVIGNRPRKLVSNSRGYGMYWQSDFPPFSTLRQETLLSSTPLSSPSPLSLAPISFRLFSEWRARNRDDGYIFLRNSLLSPPVSGNNPGAQVELSSRAKFLRPGIVEERRYRSEAVGWGGWSSNFWNTLGVSSRSTRVIDKSRLFTGI